MLKRGGLAKFVPVTCTVMWIGNLALAGVPPLAGSYSKDAIISATYASGTGIGLYAFICTVLAAFLTAFYSWRLLFMTFHGQTRADPHALEHAHESPIAMLGPLVVLSLGAIFAGWALDNMFIGPNWQHFWAGSIFNAPGNEVIEQLEDVPFWVEYAPLVFCLLGIALAYVLYISNPLLPVRLVER